MKTISLSELSLDTNAGVIEYMEKLGQGQGMVHPEIEERMKEIDRNLNGMSLKRYKNSIIIKDDASPQIVAVAFGTAYSIKIGSMFEHGINSGARTTHNWSDGTSLDLTELFGYDWIVGSWEKDETNWIQSGHT